MARVDALAGFLATEDGEHLLIAYKRAANILRIEEKKDGTSYAAKPDAALFAEDQERALYGAVQDVNDRTAGAIAQEKYEDAMAIMSGLRQVMDAFFDQVTVNAEDAALRRNRLNLLSEIRDSLDRIADFSKIEG
jgi:glycyl-tRNA synthetase beta chain